MFYEKSILILWFCRVVDDSCRNNLDVVLVQLVEFSGGILCHVLETYPVVAFGKAECSHDLAYCQVRFTHALLLVGQVAAGGCLHETAVTHCFVVGSDLLLRHLLAVWLFVKPTDDDKVLVVNPLLEKGDLKYFMLENVSYRGHDITVIYNESGEHYGVGKGLTVYVDGKLGASSAKLTSLKVKLK